MAITKDQLVVEVSANTKDAVSGIKGVTEQFWDLEKILGDIGESVKASEAALKSLDSEVEVMRVLGSEYEKVIASRKEAADLLKSSQKLGDDSPEKAKATSDAQKMGIKAELEARQLSRASLEELSATKQKLEIDDLRRQGKIAEAVRAEARVELEAFDAKIKGLKLLGHLRAEDIKMIEQTRSAMEKSASAKIAAEETAAMEKRTASFNNGLLKIGAVVGAATVAFAALKHAIDETVGEFFKSEDGVTKLANSLALMGEKDIDGSVERFKQLSESIQATTVFSDDTVIGLAQIGVAAGKTDGQIEKLINAAVALSGATGTDVNTAFNQLLNTFKGVGRGLDQMVPEIQNMTQAQLQSGDAVDLVAKKFDGFGEAMASTYAGRMEKAKNVTNSIMEELGKMLSKGLNLNGITDGALKALDGFVSMLKDIGPSVAYILAEIRQSFVNFINSIAVLALTGAQAILKLFKAITDNPLTQYLGIGKGATEGLSNAIDSLEGSIMDLFGGFETAQTAGNKALLNYNKTAEATIKTNEKVNRGSKIKIVSDEAKAKLQELEKLAAKYQQEALNGGANQIEQIYAKAEAEKLAVDEIKKKLEAEGQFGKVAKANYKIIVDSLMTRANLDAEKKRSDFLRQQMVQTEQMQRQYETVGNTQIQNLAAQLDMTLATVDAHEGEARAQGLVTAKVAEQYELQRKISKEGYQAQVMSLSRQGLLMSGIVNSAREFFGLMGKSTEILSGNLAEGLKTSLAGAIAAARQLLDLGPAKKEEAGPPKSASNIDQGFIGSVVGKATEEWGKFSGKIAETQTKSVGDQALAIGDGLADGAMAFGEMGLGIFSMIAKAPAAILGAIGSATELVQEFVDFPVKLIESLTNLDQMLTKAIDSLPGAIDKMLAKLPALLISIVQKIPDFIIMLTEQIPKIIEVLAEVLPTLVGIIIQKMPAIVSALFKGLIAAIVGFVRGLFKGIGDAMKGVKFPPVIDMKKTGKDIDAIAKKLTGATSKIFEVKDIADIAPNPKKMADNSIKAIEQATSKSVSGLSKGWVNMIGGFKTAGGMFSDMFKGVIKLYGMAHEAAGVVFKAAFEVWGVVAQAIGKVFAVIWQAGLALFQNVARIFGVIWETALALFNNAKQIFAIIWQAASVVFNAGVKIFKAVFEFASTIFDGVRTIFLSIWAAGKALFEVVSNIFSAVWEVGAALFQGWDATMKALWNLGQVLFDGVKVIFDTIWELGKSVFKVFEDGFKAIWKLGEDLFAIFKDGFDKIWDLGKAAFKVFEDGFKIIWEAGKSVFNIFKDGFNIIWDAGKKCFEIFETGFKAIWKIGEDAFTAVKKILDPILNSLSGVFDGAKSFFEKLDLAGFGGKIWNGLKTGLDGAGAIFAGLGTKVWDAISSGISNIGSALSKIFKFDGGGKGTVENFIGMDFPFVAFAKGGYVPGNAPVSGDSSANDFIPALLSPGEAVLSRSMLQDEAFRRVVEMKLAGKQVPQFAKGGYLQQKAGQAKKEVDKKVAATKDNASEKLNAVAEAVTSAVIPDWINDIFKSVKSFVPNIDLAKIVKNPKGELLAGLSKSISGSLAPFIKQVLQKPIGFADGGLVGSTDSVSAMLTPGEFVINKSAVDNVGVPFLRGINNGGTPQGGSQGATTYNFTVNIEAKQSIDESFIRQRLMPVVRDELKRSSLDGRAIVYSSGVRK